MSFAAKALIGVAFGVGFGVFVQRSGLCFAHGFGEIFLGRGRRILRIFFGIVALTTLGFVLSSRVNPELGLRAVGQIRGYGLYNLLGGMAFGAGIFISGGCILGTLRRIGEGDLNALLVLVSFIPGLALVRFVVDPALSSGYDVKKVLLPDLFGVAPEWVAGGLVLLALVGLFWATRPSPAELHKGGRR